MIARRLGYDTTCLTCEEPLYADERAYRERGVGAWHADCDPPLNLGIYRRERDRDLKRQPRTPSHSDVDD